MKKLNPEQAEALKKTAMCLSNSSILPIGELVELAFMESAIDDMTEKTPEEELAGYKCWFCGKPRLKIVHIRSREPIIMCDSCRWILTELKDYSIAGAVSWLKKRTCYQPDWNGGKKISEDECICKKHIFTLIDGRMRCQFCREPYEIDHIGERTE